MQIRVARVTASFYTTLRTALALGRTVVLMDEYWRHELGRGGAGELPAGGTRGEGGPGGVAAGGVGGLGRDAPTGPPTSRSRNGVAATSRDV